MTDEKEIRKLLAAFYNGGTTAEEEAALNDFFSSDGLPERWRTERDLFRSLGECSNIPLPEGLSERLEKSLDEHIASEKTAEKSHRNVRRLYIRIAGIAASALLCIGLFFATGKRPQKPAADTFSDPREAALAATKALSLVSMNLDKGLAQLEKAHDKIDETNKILVNLNLE